MFPKTENICYVKNSYTTNIQLFILSFWTTYYNHNILLKEIGNQNKQSVFDAEAL